MSMIPHHYGGRREGIFDPFALDVWSADPFKDFNRHGLSPMFHNSELMRNASSSFVNTSIDWRETPDSHIFKADVPGLKKEEVKVEVEEDRVLHISGERSKELEEHNDMWHRVERSSGKFMRRFRLPENAKMDQIKASMEHGVLTVVVPKEEAKKRDIKSIQIFLARYQVYSNLWLNAEIMLRLE